MSNLNESKNTVLINRPILDELKDYVPGKAIEQVQAEWNLDRVIKLASNENPLGPSPKAIEAAQGLLSQVHLYPIGHSPKLTQKMADFLKVQPENLIFTNGSDELLWMIATAYLNPGQETLSCAPTFSEYKFSTQLLDGRYKTVPLAQESYDLKALVAAITPLTKIIFVCSPNNPTGGYNTHSEVIEFLNAVPPHILVVIDQAYCEYATASDYPYLTEELNSYPNLILTRTYSKIFGMAGMRVGYGIANPQIIKTLMRVKQPFNVNLIAQKAAEAALDDAEFIAKSRQINSEGMAFLEGVLLGAGFEFYPSQANFICFKVEKAAEFVRFCESKGLILRHLKSFAMDEWVRITVGLSEQNMFFAELVKEWKNK
jgi:histidinol-phosphate aminotransferase